MEASMNKPQEHDPGSEYIEDIVESIDWWTIAAFRLFPGRQSVRAMPGAGILRRAFMRFFPNAHA